MKNPPNNFDGYLESYSKSFRVLATNYGVILTDEEIALFTKDDIVDILRDYMKVGMRKAIYEMLDEQRS